MELLLRAVRFDSRFAEALTVAYLGFHPSMVAAMQTPAQAVGATEAYLFACAVGIPFIVGYNVVAGILTGMGDSRTPFVFIAVACVINIVLDVILVKYVQLGAFGAAIATTAARTRLRRQRATRQAATALGRH